MLTIEEVRTKEDVMRTAKLADEIWHQHYAGLLSAEQIDYMVEKFQSVSALERQRREEGYHYLLLQWDGADAGFCGYNVKDGALFLSKLYIRQAYRRKGIARQVLQTLTLRAQQAQASKIWLTVNRYNEGSIAAYRAFGFQTVRTEVTEIGNGFVMDDLIMEKQIGEAA